MEKAEILNLENRRLIYNFIVKNPGLHLRELERQLNIKYFNLTYHINYLKKLGLISIKSDDNYSRIYPKNRIDENHKKILNMIRKETPRYILIFMSGYAISSQKELSSQLQKHPSTIMFHLQKLIKLGIIEPAETKNGLTITNHHSNRNVLRTPKSRETLYRIKDYDLVKKIFIMHKKSLFKDKIFKETLEYLIYANKESKEYRKKNKKNKYIIRTFDDRLDELIELMNEMLPFPFL